MSAGRKTKDLIGRRRRAPGDSDEEEESMSVGEDSQSEGSVASQAEKEEHKLGETPTQPLEQKEPTLVNGGDAKAFSSSSDTQLMLGEKAGVKALGLEQTLDFNDLSSKQETDIPPNGEAVVGTQRREQDQPRQRRGADPTFIPSRGNFFMHDARQSDQRGYMGFGRGRGRGRAFVGGPFSPAGYVTSKLNTYMSDGRGSFGQSYSSRTADAPWAHDLHESINQAEQKQFAQATVTSRALPIQTGPTAAARVNAIPEYRPYSFSSSKPLGKVQIRVALPGMKAPIPFTGVLITQYTRLPDHRPPLRRDKAVRISLPERPPSYVMPSGDRSFIFIPRAMRPNQQGLGRNRLGPSSRRTSVYGESVYSPSVGASRRSSMARDMGRELMFSPAGSVAARQMSQARPVVRLPQGVSQPPSVVSAAGSTATYGVGFPLPQTPAIEHYRETATMHQPKPQKAIQVSGIESPAALSMHAPRQQDHQPFENQLPHHMAESSFGSSVNQDAYHTYQGQAGTPLSHIPERAIHAQPFQPPTQGYGQAYYGQFSQPGFYYQPVPMYMAQSTPRTAAAQPASVEQDSSQGQAGMMAHESNGMVYYVDPSQMQSYGQQSGYMGSGSGYTMAGMVNAGQDSGWYYPNVTSEAMYYPQQ